MGVGWHAVFTRSWLNNTEVFQECCHGVQLWNGHFIERAIRVVLLVVRRGRSPLTLLRKVWLSVFSLLGRALKKAPVNIRWRGLQLRRLGDLLKCHYYHTESSHLPNVAKRRGSGWLSLFLVWAFENRRPSSLHILSFWDWPNVIAMTVSLNQSRPELRLVVDRSTPMRLHLSVTTVQMPNVICNVSNTSGTGKLALTPRSLCFLNLQKVECLLLVDYLPIEQVIGKIFELQISKKERFDNKKGSWHVETFQKFCSWIFELDLIGVSTWIMS